ncbi:MAG: hypothetical protein ACLQAT_18835 [Candidatus Binataceae bacterium]
MRAIIRFSVDNETNGALNNKLNKVLTDANFAKAQNTATYERIGLQALGLGQMLEKFWSTAHGHEGPGRLDHFWMYSDR